MAGKPVAVTLMGPTASGKTDLALALAERLPVEIVSVDSAMVYRTMDIGTAKPPPRVREQFPHHLVDIRDPAEAYSAAMFRRDAIDAVREIHARGKIPLLVGGTMLYFKALKEGLADLPAANPAVRQAIAAIAEADGWPAVHARLRAVDPDTAARLGENDRSRLQRALEIYEITGTPMSELHRRGSARCPFPLIELGIVPEDRAALHRDIEARFCSMIDQGLIEEVRALRARGDLDAELPSIKAVGYRQVWEYLDGGLSREAMVERGVIATRQLAKRQFTWLRSWQDLTVMPGPDVEVALKKVEAASI